MYHTRRYLTSRAYVPRWLLVTVLLAVCFVGGMLLASASYGQKAPTQYTDFYSSKGKLIVHAYGASTPLPDIYEGDSIRAVVRLRYTNGRTIPQRYMTTWANPAPKMLRLTTKGALRDTAWLVALDCQCRQAKSVNRPVLRPTPQGPRYFTQNLDGWHSVTYGTP